MSERQVLPEGLADMPPGPPLALALARVDVARLSSDDLHTVTLARTRQVAHEQARQLSCMLETAYAGYHDDREPLARTRKLDEFSGDQLAFTLSWTRSAMQGQLDLAQQLVERLPAVHAALSAGRIDLYKARVFVEALYLLSDDAARGIADRLLRKAEDITGPQLRERLRYWAQKADPELAKKRTCRSVTGRRFYAGLDSEGTASLGGVCLPPDRAAAAADRVERLARAAKADGDVRTLAQLRADAMLALLAGAPFTLRPPSDPHTDDADAEDRDALAAFRDRVFNPPFENPPTRPGGPSPEPAPPEPADAGHGGGPGRDGAAGRTNPGTTTPAPATPSPATPAPATSSPSPARPGGGEAAAWGGETRPDVDWPFPDGPAPDEPDPGEGYVYSDAGDALDPVGAAGLDRDPLPARHPDGRIDLGRAPTPDQPHWCVCGGVQPAARRGAVDILMNLSTLMCLDDDPALIPGWGPVIADIARQVAHDQETNPMWRWSVTDQDGNLLHHGHTGRRPTATESAFVKARDRTCRAKGCTKTAMWCDEDHRREHHKGGPSHRANLCTLCRHHHRLRHERGFVIHQINPCGFLWQAPNGRLYPVPPDGHLLHDDTPTAGVDDIDIDDIDVAFVGGAEPGPPHGYVRAVFGVADDEDW